MKLKHIQFEIPQCERIGISFSAGLDSTLLLSMIILELKRTSRENIPIIAFTTFKETGESEYTERMITLLEKHFNKKITHINSIPNRDEYEKVGIADPENIQKIYNLYNGNIKIYVAVNNSNDCPIKLPFEYSIYEHFESPFLNLSKTQLLESLYELKLDEFVPYTHTCSRQKYGNCNSCYSCQERNWAYETLGIENPKTIPLED